MYSSPIFRTSNLLVSNSSVTGPTGPGLYYSCIYDDPYGINLSNVEENQEYFHKGYGITLFEIQDISESEFLSLSKLVKPKHSPLLSKIQIIRQSSSEIKSKIIKP